VKRVRIYLRKPAPRVADRAPSRRPETPSRAASPADKEGEKEDLPSSPANDDDDSPQAKTLP
jgi:hypothetical protein